MLTWIPLVAAIILNVARYTGQLPMDPDGVGVEVLLGLLLTQAGYIMYVEHRRDALEEELALSRAMEAATDALVNQYRDRYRALVERIKNVV